MLFLRRAIVRVTAFRERVLFLVLPAGATRRVTSFREKVPFLVFALRYCSRENLSENSFFPRIRRRACPTSHSCRAIVRVKTFRGIAPFFVFAVGRARLRIRATLLFA